MNSIAQLERLILGNITDSEVYVGGVESFAPILLSIRGLSTSFCSMISFESDLSTTLSGDAVGSAVPDRVRQLLTSREMLPKETDILVASYILLTAFYDRAMLLDLCLIVVENVNPQLWLTLSVIRKVLTLPDTLTDSTMVTDGEDLSWPSRENEEVACIA